MVCAHFVAGGVKAECMLLLRCRKLVDGYLQQFEGLLVHAPPTVTG